SRPLSPFIHPALAERSVQSVSCATVAPDFRLRNPRPLCAKNPLSLVETVAALTGFSCPPDLCARVLGAQALVSISHPAACKGATEHVPSSASVETMAELASEIARESGQKQMAQTASRGAIGVSCGALGVLDGQSGGVRCGTDRFQLERLHDE